MAGFATTGQADDLFKSGLTQSLASDRRATIVGDMLTVVIVQSAESSTTMQNGSRKSSKLGGSFSAGSIDESADISFGGSYDGRGAVTRSERFVTQMTAMVTGVQPNGDLVIAGRQRLNINSEMTTVEVRGQIRPSDIDGENRIASNRIGNAEINYNGKGFVTRSAKPGLIQKIFSFLGLN